MSRGDRSDRIPGIILDGINNAFETYSWLTNGKEGLSGAPEYLISVEVARHLREKIKSSYVNLEYSVGQALEDAGSSKKGRPSSALRKGGRFDILLSRMSGDPWCAIEIKHRVWTAKAHLESDIKRLRDVVGHRNYDSTIRCGALGFFSDKGQPNAEDLLDNLNTSTEHLAAKLLEGTGLFFRIESKFTAGDRRDGRQAYCLFIEARKPRAHL